MHVEKLQARVILVSNATLPEKARSDA